VILVLRVELRGDRLVGPDPHRAAVRQAAELRLGDRKARLDRACVDEQSLARLRERQRLGDARPIDELLANATLEGRKLLAHGGL
jgi:hypothetical protein